MPRLPLLPCLAAIVLAAAGARAERVLTLDDCLSIARRQNPDVLIAAKQWEQARAQVTTARGAALPSVRADGYYQRRERDLATTGGLNQNRLDDYNLNLLASQNFYSSGAVRARIAAAKLGVEIARQQWRAARDAAALAVRLSFYQVLAAQESLGVRSESLRLLEAQVRDQDERLRAGTVSSLNVSRAQVALASERPSFFQAENELVTARLALAQAMGEPLAAGRAAPDFRVRGGLDGAVASTGLEDCLRRARANRPEIQARQLEIEVQERLVIADKAGNRPQLSGYAGYQRFSQNDPGTKVDSFGGFVAGVRFDWTLFDGLATPGRVRATTARASAARQALRAAELAVETEVRTALELLRQADATVASQGRTIGLSREALRLSLDNFGAGLATQLDILQAQVDLTRTRVIELGGRSLRAAAAARLLRAVGTPDTLESPLAVVVREAK